MSSYFDDASLVMIPSGYKTSKVYSVKPTDGSGDLTFSRSNDTATRVNSAGLIEKVRTNLLTYSNTFSNAAWSQTYVPAPTANAIANPLTGAVDAWKLVEDGTNNFHYIIQTPTFAAGEVSFSFYAKSAERTTCSAFLSQGGNVGASFNLSTGVATASGTGNTASMVSVGGGWYRCIVANNGSSTVANQVRIGVADGALSSYAGDGTSGIYIYAAQAEQGVATDYIATTSAAVSVGPVANVPRLDYLNSSCPRLLLEPQRTNKITYSENQGPTGTNWYPSTTWTVTNNAVVSPSGYQDADTLTETTSTGFHSGYFNATIESSYTGTYTISAFAKYNGRIFVLNPYPTGAGRTYFDLQNGTVLQAGTGVTAKIENYGNGWYRCICTASFSSEIVAFEHMLASAVGTLQYTGNGTSGVHIWGCMAEAGAYATSYIPTLGAAVTRGADAASKTGISSLTSASEYTIYWEGTHIPTGQYNSFATFYNNANNNDSARFYRNNTDNQIRAAFFNSATGLALDLASGVTTQTAKCAIRVKAGSYALYVNGVLVNSSTSALAPASNLDAVNLQYFSSGQSFDQKTGQVLFFKTALSNADLAALTA